MDNARQLLMAALDAVERIENERDEALSEATRRARENGDQCDEIAALREELDAANQRIAELETQLSAAQDAREGIETR